ncbi:MAG: endonuclease/exonuclease/phosphatase family protein [Flavobacteriales bacterium]|nr:endonuclease/exonuclease/phosphatase family protein [Flavobacteriales bacterium]
MKREEPWIILSILAIGSALVFAPDDFLPMLMRAFLIPWSWALPVLAVLLFLRRYRPAAASALFVALLILLHVRIPVAEHGRTNSGTGLSIAHFNVLQPNTRKEEVMDLLRERDADIFSVQELDHDWAEHLERSFAQSHPYHLLVPRTDCYGMALFSKVPLQDLRADLLEGTPYIEALVALDHDPVRIVAVHATSPQSHGHFQQRNRQLGQLAVRLKDSEHPTVLIGDLNTVPWDRSFLRLCSVSGLRAGSRSSFRTWPSIGPFALMPLDHVLASSGLVAGRISSFPIPGSDHRGISARIDRADHAL